MTAASPHKNTQRIEKSKSVCLYREKPGLFFRDCRKRIKKQQEQRMTLHFKTWSRQLPKLLHLVHIADGKMIHQQILGTVLMLRTEQMVLSKNRHQTIHKKDKIEETEHKQYPDPSLKSLYTGKTTTPLDKLHISETICQVCSTHNRIPLFLRFWISEFRQLSGSKKWKKSFFKDIITSTWGKKQFQHTDTNARKTLILNSDHFQKSLFTTHTSATLNMNMTLLGWILIWSRQLENK